MIALRAATAKKGANLTCIVLLFLLAISLASCKGSSSGGTDDPDGSEPSSLDAPQNLTATASSSEQIDLSWSEDSEGESGFIVERSIGGSFSPVATLAANTTSYRDTGLTPATTYTYRVYAFDAGAESPWSTHISATTEAVAVQCPEETPQDPANLYFVDGSNLCGSCSDATPKHANSMTNPWCTIQHAADNASPGDTIYVREGTYKEEVTLNVSGTQEHPITLSAYPDEEVVLEGSELIDGFSACASAEMCGGNENWAHIYHATLPTDIAAVTSPLVANLHEGDDMLWVSQEPDQPDPFYLDNIDNFYPVARENMTSTSLTAPTVLNQADENYWDGAYVLVWVSHNTVNVRGINSFEPASDTVHFDETNNPPYTDRDGFFSLYNSIHLIDQPGEYTLEENTDGSKTIYLWPRQGTDAIAISFRQFGIDINQQSYITLNGFVVQRYSSTETTKGVGIGTVSRGDEVRGITVSNNTIRRNRKDSGGYGGIFLDDCIDCSVYNNRIEANAQHRGIFFMNPQGCVIRNNTVTSPGATGIGLYTANECEISYNTVTGSNGSHANTITIYLPSNNILVASNKVYDNQGGMTFHNVSNLTIYNNYFDASGGEYNVNEWPGESGGTLAVLNNTFVNNSRNTSLNIGGKGTAEYVVRNNVLDGFCPDEPSTVWTHNLYTGLQWCQDERYGWALEPGGIIEENLARVFADPANSNFSLKDGSPAINAGTDISAHLPDETFPGFNFSRDHDGNPRVQGSSTDIGAYEHTQ